MSYQSLIYGIDRSVNPAGVEASMRLQYGSLSHLDKSVFAEEVEIAKQMKGSLRGIAESFGMLKEFERWEGAKES